MPGVAREAALLLILAAREEGCSCGGDLPSAGRHSKCRKRASTTWEVSFSFCACAVSGVLTCNAPANPLSNDRHLGSD